jgi:hypothetical protein
MRRPRFYIAALLIAVLLVVLGIRYVLADRAQRKRESEYAKTLQSFSPVLKTGMSRQQVEDYFKDKNISFTQTCCVSVKQFSPGVYDNAYDDLVKIGEDGGSWFCEFNVYIAFQFLGSGKNGLPHSDASDKLKDLTIYRRGEDCL